MDIEFRLLESSQLHESFLKDFNRFQWTARVRFVDKDQDLYKNDYFIDDWDSEQKRLVIDDLINCVASGGSVIGAYDGDRLVGFANIEGKLLGSKKEYFEMPYIHVSSDKRNCGIGKKLFRLCCDLAQQQGAVKLYIAAHPAVATQEFYQRMGCVLAVEIIPEILDREPLDIQLEFDMKLGDTFPSLNIVR